MLQELVNLTSSSLYKKQEQERQDCVNSLSASMRNMFSEVTVTSFVSPHLPVIIDFGAVF